MDKHTVFYQLRNKLIPILGFRNWAIISEYIQPSLRCHCCGKFFWYKSKELPKRVGIPFCRRCYLILYCYEKGSLKDWLRLEYYVITTVDFVGEKLFSFRAQMPQMIVEYPYYYEPDFFVTNKKK